MSPIVDGIAQKYPSQIDVIRVNARDDTGLEAFRQSGLSGHPGYLILVPEGDIWQVVYRATGIVDSAELERQVNAVLQAD